jgi:tetratricopeptide (TPR) repeat protein
MPQRFFLTRIPMKGPRVPKQQTEPATLQKSSRFFPEQNSLVFLFILAILVAAVYSSVFSAGFIWDDDDYVINNQLLRSLAGLRSIWFEPGATPQYYPMVFTLFWTQFQLWGLQPFGYHLVNILLHAANALLLWLCLQRIHVPSAFWVALLFALHPVQVESVAWITELKNVLSLFFYLLSLLAYLQYADAVASSATAAKRRLAYALSLLLFLLSLFSKTVSGSLPAAILLIHWWQTGRICRRDVVRLLPFFALAILFGMVTARLEISHVLARGPEWDFSPVDRVLIAGRAVWFYAGKLVWPYPLMFNYPRWQIDAGSWWQYLFPLAVIGTLIALWCSRGRFGRGPLAAVLFFVGTLFPALGFFNVYPMRYSFVADHFQYAASIGMLILMTAGLELFLSRRGIGAAGRCALFMIPATFAAILTWSQGHVYRDRITLFSATIARNPASWLSYANRGRDYALAGRDDLALPDLDRALALNPLEADALQCRGSVLLKRKEFDRALADFDKSIELQPKRADYYLNRCKARRIAGLAELALADADMAIRLDPNLAEGYIERMTVHAIRGEYQKALEDCYRARELGYPLADAELQALLQWIGKR